MAEIFCENVERLVARVQNGDDDAFELLTERFLPLIRHEVGRYFTGMDAKEAYGEAVSVLHDAARHYEPNRGTTFGLYAKICLARAMYAHSQALPGRAPLADAESEELFVDSENDVIREDCFARMLLCIRTMTSDKEYAVLCLYLQGYSEKEISAHLRYTEKQVANAKARLFRKLRENAADLSQFYF